MASDWGSSFKGLASKAATTASSIGARVSQSPGEASRLAAEKARQAADAAKGARNNMVKSTTERSIDWALRTSGKSIKESLVEDDAPQFIKSATESIFDAVWPDIAKEVKLNVMEAIDEKLDKRLVARRQPRQVKGLRKLRAWFLYSFQPYDLSTYHAVRRPSTIFLLVWSSLPGLHSAFWLLMFLLMDKRDEYTLINFILSFKSLQFFTLGFIGLLVGAAQYHWCLTASLTTNTCDTSGPGSGHFFYFFIGAFYVQSVLTWFAFALLPYSKRKGGSQHHAEDEAVLTEDPGAVAEFREDAGGYLTRLVFWDMLVFAAIAAWVTFYGTRAGALAGDEFHWQFRATLYWTKTTYGLLSLPFLLFVVPPFNSIFTHAMPTAYDQAGDVVGILSARQRKQRAASEATAGKDSRKSSKSGKPGSSWLV